MNITVIKLFRSQQPELNIHVRRAREEVKVKPNCFHLAGNPGLHFFSLISTLFFDVMTGQPTGKEREKERKKKKERKSIVYVRRCPSCLLYGLLSLSLSLSLSLLTHTCTLEWNTG
jgi:hypothetical protein